MSRIAIWAITFGDAVRPLQRMWLRSLLEVGKWDGDIIILTDETRTEGRVRWVDIRPQITFELVKGYNNTKPFIQRLPGIWKNYDFLLYSDIDVLVTSNRVRSILEAATTEGKIVVQRDAKPISSGRQLTGYDLLTDEERVRFGDDSFCAGLVGVPTTDLGRNLLADWHDANAASGFAFQDQIRLVLLLIRKYNGQWRYLRETAFGGLPADNPTWIHFTTGKRRPLMEQHYREVLGL